MNKKNTAALIIGALALILILLSELVDWGDATDLIKTIVRFSAGGCILAVIKLLGFSPEKRLRLNKEQKRENVLLIASLALICICNAPILGLISGRVTVIANTNQIILFLLSCLSVGFFEEVLFRGVILKVFLIMTANKKHGDLLAVLLNAFAFSLAHFSGFSFGVLIQLGYSLLLGFAWGFLSLKTNCIWWGVALHFLFNAAGLMTRDLSTGMQWDNTSMLIMAIAAVAVALVFLYYIKKHISLSKSKE